MKTKRQKKLYLQSKKRYFQKISGTAEKLRLSIFRSHNHIYAQLINDEKHHTLVSNSSLTNELKSQKQTGQSPKEISYKVGFQLGEFALQKGITKVIFDRGMKPYHGRIQELAEGARKAGLIF